MPPSALTHDPLASLMVTFWIMVFAGYLMFFVAMGLEILLVMLDRVPQPISFSRAVHRMRRAWANR